MAQCTRNKIAQSVPAALRVLPANLPRARNSRNPKEPDRVSKNLDEIDLKILSEIQADGQITNVELAKRVGISPPPCLRRVRTLEEEGYIQGYRGLLDPRRLGFDVTVFASVHLSSQAEADLRAFEEFVRAEPLVRECWMLSGEVDFILKCVAPDMATFQDFVTHLTVGAACAQCQDVAGAAQFQIRGGGAARFEGGGLRTQPSSRGATGRGECGSRIDRQAIEARCFAAARCERVCSPTAQLTSASSRRGCTARRLRSTDRGRRSRTGSPACRR